MKSKKKIICPVCRTRTRLIGKKGKRGGKKLKKVCEHPKCRLVFNQIYNLGYRAKKNKKQKT